MFTPLILIPISAIFILSTADYSRDIIVLLETFLSVNTIGIPVAYLAVLFYGIPMHLIIKKLGLASYTMHALAGAIIPIPFLLLLPGVMGSLDEVLIAGSIFTVFGTLIGITFYYIVKNY